MKGKSLTLIGTAISLAFSGNVAMAQSSNSTTSAPTEIKMSPEGMKILCKRFPLNSRCPGGIPLDQGFSTIPANLPPSSLSDTDSDPNVDTTTVPVLPTEPNLNNSTQSTPPSLTPAAPNLNDSSQMTPVPGDSSVVEFRL
jgi:hypothetical protein